MDVLLVVWESARRGSPDEPQPHHDPGPDRIVRGRHHRRRTTHRAGADPTRPGRRRSRHHHPPQPDQPLRPDRLRRVPGRAPQRRGPQGPRRPDRRGEVTDMDRLPYTAKNVIVLSLDGSILALWTPD